MSRVAPLVLVALAAAAPGVAQMPDPASMSGMSMPAPELPDGSVTVKVVKGEITNNLVGISVELQGGSQVMTAKTDGEGRATFTGLVPGTTVRAIAVVDGKTLESLPIEIPTTGGMRTLLAAPADGAAATSAAGQGSEAATQEPASADTSALSLGGNSRVATEFSDDVLQVFLLLEIVNRSSSPVAPASALVFDMAPGAAGTTVLDGSTPQANAKGPRVTVPGPFPPGSTPLQIAYRLDNVGGSHAIEQKFPLPLDAVSIAVQRLGDMKVSSPQVAQTVDRPIQQAVFALGNGPRLDAGVPLVIDLANLPHRSRLPVYAALGLAALIVLWAVYAGFAPGRADAASGRRRDLLAEREKGLAALAALEQQYQSGALDAARYEARRAALFAQLERIYGELDAGGDTPGGQGVAA